LVNLIGVKNNHHQRGKILIIIKRGKIQLLALVNKLFRGYGRELASPKQVRGKPKIPRKSLGVKPKTHGTRSQKIKTRKRVI